MAVESLRKIEAVYAIHRNRAENPESANDPDHKRYAGLYPLGSRPPHYCNPSICSPARNQTLLVPIKFCKSGSQPPPGNIQILRHHPRLGNCRHEVGVADPSWQPMQMQVTRDARTSRLSQVHPKIDAMRRVERQQCPLCLFAPDPSARAPSPGAAPPGLPHVYSGITITCPEVYGNAFRQIKHSLPRSTSPPAISSLVYRHSIGDCVVHRGQQIAENAAQIAGPSV